MSRALQPHGTIAAHRRHQRQGEAPCADCKKAWAEYHRAYVAGASAEVLAKKKAYDRAYTRAVSRLIAAHPDEMAALIAEEKEAGP